MVGRCVSEVLEVLQEMNIGGVVLNGVNQWGVVSHSSSLNAGVADFGLNISFKAGSGVGGPIFYKFDSGTSKGVKVELSTAGALTVTVNGLILTATGPYNDSTWKNLELGIDKQKYNLVTLFINGTLVDSESAVGLLTIDNVQNIEIGRNYSTSYFTGSIGELSLRTLPRNLGEYSPRVKQFSDDSFTLGLWHFNEGLATTIYDMSENRNNLTLQNSPSPTQNFFVKGPFQVSPVTIIRECVWRALDAYSDLDTYVTQSKLTKYKLRPFDTFPEVITLNDCPALLIKPSTVPELMPETSAFHALSVPVEIKGYLHTTEVDEIEFFWWLVVRAAYSAFESNITAGHFNWSYIQNFKVQGPSFNVAMTDQNRFFSQFSDIWTFETRYDLLRGD